MPTSPWTAAEIANAKSRRTAIEYRVNRGAAIGPAAFCCGSNTIQDVKDPSCIIAISPLGGYLDTLFQFDGSNSFAPDGTIISYEWDFGDGNSASGVTAEHRYEVEGDYAVILTIIDVLGLERKCVQGVTVYDPTSFPALLDSPKAAWVGKLGSAAYTLAFYGDLGPNVAYDPVWYTVSDGLPAGARVNDISVNPHNPEQVLAACGLPTFAVQGGVFQCEFWGGAFADVTPPKPDTWKDPDEDVGGEANKDTAADITLTDAEWDNANWVFCEWDRHWPANKLAIAVVKKSGSARMGSFYCIYHFPEAQWEVIQFWTNKDRPWHCQANQAAISWLGGRYVFVTTDGSNLSWSNEYGRAGSWQTTAALPAGFTLQGAVWTYYNPALWESNAFVYIASNESPYVLGASISNGSFTWQAKGYHCCPAGFCQWWPETCTIVPVEWGTTPEAAANLYQALLHLVPPPWHESNLKLDPAEKPMSIVTGKGPNTGYYDIWQITNDPIHIWTGKYGSACWQWDVLLWNGLTPDPGTLQDACMALYTGGVGAGAPQLILMVFNNPPYAAQPALRSPLGLEGGGDILMAFPRNGNLAETCYCVDILRWES